LQKRRGIAGDEVMKKMMVMDDDEDVAGEEERMDDSEVRIRRWRVVPSVAQEKEAAEVSRRM
jgi:hypothetical protein